MIFFVASLQLCLPGLYAEVPVAKSQTLKPNNAVTEEKNTIVNPLRSGRVNSKTKEVRALRMHTEYFTTPTPLETQEIDKKKDMKERATAQQAASSTQQA